MSEQYGEQYEIGCNTLLVGTADVVKARVSTGDSLSKFAENGKSPFVKISKRIFLAEEVNKIRELPAHPHIVATATDSPSTYVWNTDRQPDRAKDKEYGRPSVADLILVGHESNAEFSLATSTGGASFCSGDKDGIVLLWSLDDDETKLNGLVAEKLQGRQSVASGSLAGVESPELKPRMRFEGHTAVVNDVCFHPSTSHEIVSVSDDRTIRFWDSRKGPGHCEVAKEAHGADITCVDWSASEENLVVTGCGGGIVKVFDRRKLEGAVVELRHHSKSINCVQWCPDRAGVLASSSEDGLLNVWDITKTSARTPDVPPQLMIQHSGHWGEVCDFHWNPHDPWTVISTSNDAQTEHLGAGCVQVWRPSDLIYPPEDEVLKELEEQREKLVTH